MAGQPVARRLAERIEDDGGDAVLFDRVESGRALVTIAEDYGVSRETLRRWINKTPARREAYDEAKADSADALVEEAGQILDDAKTDSGPDMQKARSRAEHRRWLASKRDRVQYGDDPTVAVGVHLDLGSLHLDALRQAGHMTHGVPVVESEVLEGDEV